ncbi:MAG: class I SAM-dependent methyltransferase [bacterium]
MARDAHLSSGETGEFARRAKAHFHQRGPAHKGVPRSQHAVWEVIAASFDRSRTRTWPHVHAFVAGLPAESRVLDLMAGNGRHTTVITAAGHQATWLDWSRPAARIAAARNRPAHIVVGDAAALPFADHSFDAAIVVAGLHSLPSAAGRLQALQELGRVLAPQGTAQVTVWSRDAPRFSTLGAPGDELDVELPWRSDGHDETRSYHLYTDGALRRDCTAAGLVVRSMADVTILGRGGPDNLVAVVAPAPS